ncbi:hypothetical protein GMB86_09580 [Terrilactibacillus sp. BCM23-1]|uniref:Uncharacterized protein n=1 Tax=Terrilactibacillus tamarindi TaxID=2599694 RepID=A0A6N8CT91_9BACI|nr:hypothetical protein [Terrilactibacillus tamarindi]MTT32253.1 hypothetical protein [Terrilactibacillus tamarindi]
MILWIIFSLILHLLAFYLIIHLVQRLKHLEQQHPEELKREIEETMTAYLTDMEQENDRFIQELNKSKKHEVIQSNEPTNHEKQGKAIDGKDNVMNKSKQQVTYDAVTDWIPPIKSTNEERHESSLLAKALHLKQKGQSITEIAKALGRGEGEIALLLKINEKKTL